MPRATTLPRKTPVGLPAVDHWRSPRSAWKTECVRDDDGWHVTATRLEGNMPDVPRVISWWTMGDWRQAVQSMLQILRDIEDGLYTTFKWEGEKPCRQKT